MSKESIRKDAINDIIDCLEDGYDGYLCDLHNEVFNTDYYVVGTADAKERLREYDVFDAIEKVIEYEKDNFGEIYTDVANPETLINMLFYVIGEEVLWDVRENCKTYDDNYNEECTPEIAKMLIETLEKLL